MASVALLLGVGVLVSQVVQAAVAMPSLTNSAHQLGETSVIYDLHGNAVAAVPGPQFRLAVPLSQIPLLVQHAFVAVEDRRFYSNEGFDLRGILRAAWADLRGRPLQGGSTITQQLAKIMYLSPKDTLVRKLKEAWLALEIARRYTKAEILDRYLNWIYLGQSAWGVQAASERYFGVPVSHASLPQAALLAGLNDAPSAYDPLVHPKAAVARRNTVLVLMQQQGYISAAQEKAAMASPLGLAPRQASGSGDYPYPWFVDAVISQLETQDHLSARQVTDGGLHIYTTLDPKIQTAAQQAVANLSQHGGIFAATAKPLVQAAEAVIDPSNGDVVAIVGGRTHSTMMAFDRALQAERQPGSSIKPLVDYIPALMHGLTSGTTVDDVVRTYGSGPSAYTPQNYNYIYYGLTTLTEALRRSVNVVAVKVLHHIGVETGLHNAQNMGLPLTQSDDHLALALGGTTDCCTPLDMARAYAAIANGGLRVRPRMITKVVAPNGQVLVRNPVAKRRVIPAAVAYVMTRMLETVDEPQPNVGWDVLSGPLDSNWGTGYDATVQDNVPGWPTAAKTGTTNSDRDAWYVGFTARYAAAVWVGYDHPKGIPGLFGDTYAGPIFKQTMEAAVAGLKPENFPRPPGVVTAPIDIRAAPWTVAKPGPLTPAQDIRDSWFVAGTQPTASNPLWVQDQVTTANPPTLWEPGCPGTPVTRVYLNRKPYTAAWAQQTAKRIGVSDWQSLIPVDMSLAPPSTTCLGGSATTTPGTAAGAPSGTSACGIAPGAAPCSLVLTQGQPPVPSVLQAVAGSPLQLSVRAASGVNLLLIPRLGLRVLIAAGQTKGLTLVAQQPGTYSVLDITSSGEQRATLVVTPAAAAAGGASPPGAASTSGGGTSGGGTSGGGATSTSSGAGTASSGVAGGGAGPAPSPPAPPPPA